MIEIYSILTRYFCRVEQYVEVDRSHFESRRLEVKIKSCLGFHL